LLPEQPRKQSPENNSRLEPRLLRISEAAVYLGSTCWFIRSKLWAGEIPFLRLGKRFLIDRSDLDLFIDREKSEI